MKLNEIAPQEGSTKNRMRVGRGIGSGKGKTSGKGQKGQKARSGVAIKGFEGGQMPLYQRLPKSGFSNKKFTVNMAEVTLGKLQAAIDSKKIDAAKLVDEDILVKAGVVNKKRDGIKLLASGELKSKINLKLSKVSAAAQKAVEKAGGKIELIEKIVQPVVRKKSYK
ncbi:MAG: 50S ribosomal protein L15 [Alphaproteobacteria bacterium]|nr:50S ribosomal protein L15 [Alphaproteobacteria bacterium]